MTRNEFGRRTFLGATATGGVTLSGVGTGGAAATASAGLGSTIDLHTQVTYRALVDAVVPETPELESELGPEHVPGGLEIGLAEFLITYVDGLFSFDPGILAEDGNLQLATPVAHVLDKAARALVLRGENESRTRVRRPLELFDGEHSSLAIVLAAGPFARLSRADRLRAIGQLDDLAVELSPTEDTLFELDAGMLGQLVIGFTEMIYYSEWEGYDDFWRPPSERDHPNEPAAVQGWRQTGFPGYADGNASLRGYLGTPSSSLGAGETWTVIDDGPDPVAITLEPGSFADDAYDTSDYEEPFPAERAGPVRSAEPAGEGDGADDADDEGDTTDGADDPDRADDGDGPDDTDEPDDGDEPDDTDEQDDDGGWLWGWA